jgi:2-amino-4-hydroxy-6-hydroxymethyldihydropteridine diphosphokinase
MIIIGLGANLPSPDFGSPQATLTAALAALDATGIRVLSRSRWYESEPLPKSDQPWFVNAVASVETTLAPEKLLTVLLETEQKFGRRRSVANAARAIDLDLLIYDDIITEDPSGLVLPHPRLQDRAFVLLPLREIAPGWRHPVLGRSIEDLIRDLPRDQLARPIE